MIKTITLGTCVSVQGQLVRTLPNGRIAVQVGDKVFTGYPVDKIAA